MKRLFLALAACAVVLLAFSQSGNTAGKEDITLTAASINREGSVVRLKGQARVETNEVLLSADEADYHTDTREVEARGNVRVKFRSDAKPAKPQDRNPSPAGK